MKIRCNLKLLLSSKNTNRKSTQTLKLGKCKKFLTNYSKCNREKNN